MQELKEASRSNEDINTDGRVKYDWASNYPKAARGQIMWESVFLCLVFAISSSLLVLHLLGFVYNWLGLNLTSEHKLIFDFIFSFTFAGALGGITFGLKYFYRVVAHGFWTEDRRYWRVFSPLISATIAFVVGWMSIAGIFYAPKELGNAWAITFGFLSGYFADSVVGVMADIASRVFGSKKEEKK